VPKRGWLLSLLVVVAFVATIAILRPWGASVATIDVRSADVARAGVAERPPATQPMEIALPGGRAERNPALQTAGPPDPESQRTAAASAARAAQAAADLAAAQ